MKAGPLEMPPQPLNAGRCKIAVTWPSPNSGNWFLPTGTPHAFSLRWILSQQPMRWASARHWAHTLAPGPHLSDPSPTIPSVTSEQSRALGWEGTLQRWTGNKDLEISGAPWLVKISTQLPALPSFNLFWGFDVLYRLNSPVQKVPDGEENWEQISLSLKEF